MIIRKYEKGDLFQVVNLKLCDSWGLNLVEPEDKSLAWSAVVGVKDVEYILGCGGFRPFWNGVYEAWMVPRRYDIMHENVLATTRYIKKLFEELGAHRVQATVRRDNAIDAKYVKMLGFKWEGTLHQYGPDKQDFDMYALVR